MNYELFYSNSGHCGPFPDLETAKRAAQDRLKGDLTLYAIEIRPYDSQSIGGFKMNNLNSIYLMANNLACNF